MYVFSEGVEVVVVVVLVEGFFFFGGGGGGFASARKREKERERGGGGGDRERDRETETGRQRKKDRQRQKRGVTRLCLYVIWCICLSLVHSFVRWFACLLVFLKYAARRGVRPGDLLRMNDDFIRLSVAGVLLLLGY